MNVYCKKLTQVELGYGLLNVAQYFSCEIVLYFSCLHGSWISSQYKVNTFVFRPNTK